MNRPNRTTASAAKTSDNKFEPENPAGRTHQLSYRISRLSLALEAQALALLKQSAGISLGQWRVLSMMASDEIDTSRALVSATGMDPASVSRILQTLEKSGLVSTQRPETNRRLLQIKLTAKGGVAYRSALPVMRVRQAKLLAALSQSEQRTIFKLLDKLQTAAEPLAPSTGSAVADKAKV